MPFCLGPMSKNIVDSIIEYSLEFNRETILIPSRRQIDIAGGYVNNWTTKDFCRYVKEHSKNSVFIERDHGGPGQGYYDDDGIASLIEDAKYMDILHIDPWKKYPIYSDALEWTVKLINLCYNINPKVLFEVGTEEGIRPVSCEELERYLTDLQSMLGEVLFNRIKFVVIQCGTQLLEKENIGDFNSCKLSTMMDITKKFGKIAKEHNGDWVNLDTIIKKKKYGLEYINIAPEIGEIETKVILSYISKNKDDMDTLYNLCLSSNRWVKWVSNDFNPEKNKERLILICGHYVFSNPSFIKIKEKYSGIDNAIKEKIKDKLMELDNIYTVRNACILCNKSNLQEMFDKDKKIALSSSLYSSYIPGYFIPYNIQHCLECHSFQNKYIGDPKLVYAVNHIDSYGVVKNKMHTFFSEFITNNNNIHNIIEIGACHDVLSRSILEHKPEYSINIIDPFYIGNTDNLNIIRKFFEDIDIEKIDSNTIVMSSVFEHFYNPIDVINKIFNAKNIQYVILNHPDLEYGIKNDIYINFNTEHTFYIEIEGMVQLFEKYGFTLLRKQAFQTHTIALEFKRTRDTIKEDKIIKHTGYNDIKKYLARLNKKIDNINAFMTENPHMDFYIWPTSIHLAPLFVHGLNVSRICAFLDNSPNKINKYLYGYNIPCKSFEMIVNTNTSNTCILLGGSPIYRNELSLKTSQCKFLEI